MEDMINFKTLQQHSSSWLKGRYTLYKYKGFWNSQKFHEWAFLAHKTFKPNPSDVIISSCPKTGTTWLKALTFAIVTRNKFDESTNPLLTTVPHECIPLLEREFEQIEYNRINNNPDFIPFIATHLPYNSLPESVVSSNCKIVYIYRNTKDVVVYNYQFFRKACKVAEEEACFEDAFDEFCQGISWYGPYWDHILGYWKASLERPQEVLLMKYEDMKRDARSNVKRLAEFIGHPFTIEEEKEGVIECIVKLCSFEKLSNLEVNKSGVHSPVGSNGVENQLYFRKAEDGDWEKYFTDEMKEKIDELMDQKMEGTGLVLK
ncbi:unnamed protein product [Lactuca virosa]|uniref:Sulfotransferase n=1 Tax=Lactuca virosa TaxID=75947 RepID=A0AAU9P919_9ASTR|nr:unnamed protein product [Lactuca virosa]